MHFVGDCCFESGWKKVKEDWSELSDWSLGNDRRVEEISREYSVKTIDGKSIVTYPTILQQYRRDVLNDKFLVDLPRKSKFSIPFNEKDLAIVVDPDTRIPELRIPMKLIKKVTYKNKTVDDPIDMGVKYVEFDLIKKLNGKYMVPEMKIIECLNPPEF